MKYFILFTFLFLTNCFSFDLKKIKIYGETNYEQKENKKFTTSLNFDYKIILHEPSHKKWRLYINGVVSPDYDHFGKEMKVNTFTTLGIDF